MTRHFRFDDVDIDLQGFRLFKAGHVVSVEPKALHLLIFLAERPGILVTRHELIDAVWKEAFVTDHVLNRIIGQLRKSLDDDAKEPRYIETVPTLGYRFIAQLEPEPGTLVAPPATSSSPAELASEPPPAPRRKHRPLARPGSLGRKLWDSRTFVIAVHTVTISALIVAITLAVLRGRPRFQYFRPGFATQITSFPGLSNYPVFSPDDTSVAYSRDAGNGFEIFVRQLTPDAREIQITSDGGQNMEAAWSPDGKLIAYYSYGKGGIWLIPPLGGPARQLTSFGSHPAWSPDGQWIVFQSNPISNLSFEGAGFARGSALWIIHSDGTDAKQITVPGTPQGGHGDPSWSPDGKRIVFVSEDEPRHELWSVKFDGTGLVNLTPSGSSFLPHDPVYSPDGKSIIYGGLQGLWQIQVRPAASAPLGDPVQITNSAAFVIKNLAFSHDGKRLLYSAEVKTSSLLSLALSPSGQPAAAPIALRPDAGCYTTLPAFSPDGKRIAFYECRPGSPGQIWMMDANGANAQQLTSIPVAYCAPSWYPDGRHILYLSDVNPHPKVFSVDSETRQEQLVAVLHQDINRVGLSPDGKQIVFDATAGSVWNIWMLDPASGKTKQITFQQNPLAYPLWSPDGKLLSADLEHGEDTNIVVFPAAGGALVSVTFDKGDNWSGGWSRDGDSIVFARRPSNGFWNVFAVSRSTKVEKQLTHYSRVNQTVYAPVISPRGDQIVYEYSETNGNIWMLDLSQPK